MVTFVPQFVSSAARDWDLAVQDDMAAAGLDPRDLEGAVRLSRPPWRPAVPRATVADVVAHVEHAREVAGVEHIGIGADFDGTTGPAGRPGGRGGLSGAVRRPARPRLERSGLRQLAGGNILRVLHVADAA